MSKMVSVTTGKPREISSGVTVTFMNIHFLYAYGTKILKNEENIIISLYNIGIEYSIGSGIIEYAD